MKLSTLIACACITSFPLIAIADDLKIANRTDFDISFSINKHCSNNLGVIQSDTVVVVPEKDFNKACEHNPSRCYSIVYSKPNCRGKDLGEVGFNTKHGVSYIIGSQNAERVSITGNGFNLIFHAEHPVK